MRRMVAAILLIAAFASAGRAATWDFLPSSPGAILPDYVVNDFVIDTGTGPWLSGEILLQLDSGRIYQSPVGGDVPPNYLLLPANPKLEFDTYLSGGTLTTTTQTGAPAQILGGAVDLGGSAQATLSDTLVNAYWGDAESPWPTQTATIGRFTLSADAVGTYRIRVGYTTPNWRSRGAIYGGGEIAGGLFGEGVSTLDNGSFEQASLIGWAAEGSGIVRKRSDGATDGNYRAEILARAGALVGGATRQEETLLGKFSLNAGDTIALDYRLLWETYGEEADVTATSARVELLEDATGALEWDQTLEPAAEWTELSHVIAEPGEYTLQLWATADALDVGSQSDPWSYSRLDVDHVRVVPEPAMLVLLAGLLLAGAIISHPWRGRRA